ncbi:MAG: hypothetical protein N3G80_01255 [Candidatus Micrarchaeota archaeon]|nr:hypothetical protein [Candidatus Micrarchaeota archaeon]
MDSKVLSFNNYFSVISQSVLVCLLVALVVLMLTKEPMWYPFGLLLGCAVALFLSRFRSISIDKETSTIKYSLWSVTSKSSVSLPFSSISAIVLKKIRLAKGSTHNLIFKQHDGKELNTEELVTKKEDAKKIADLIGVPFTYEEPASLVEILDNLEFSPQDSKKDNEAKPIG